MKIAVSSYSFSQAMNDGRMGILDVIPKAKAMGYEFTDEELGAEFEKQIKQLGGFGKIKFFAGFGKALIKRAKSLK